MIAYITKTPDAISDDRGNVIHFSIGDLHYCVSTTIFVHPKIQRIPLVLVEKKMNHSGALWYHPDSSAEARVVLSTEKREYLSYLLSPAETQEASSMGEVVGSERKVGKTLIDVAERRKRRQEYLEKYN